MRQPKNVLEKWVMYDNCLIGDLATVGISNYPGSYATFDAVADDEEVSFLDIRNSAEVTKSYCNIAAKEKTDWSFYLNSIGIRVNYPTPNQGSEHDVDGPGEWANAHMLAAEIMNHAYFELTVSQDIILTAKPLMLPSGYGAYGYMMNSGSNNAALSHAVVVDHTENGVPDLRNRFSWDLKAFEIPKNTPLKGRLRFSKYAKELLRGLSTPENIDFEGTENDVPAIINIELSLFGYRAVQQRGELHFTGGGQGNV